MLQLGWKAGTEQYPPDELLEYAIAAEQAGFDSTDTSDHFHPLAEKGQACFVWSWLGAVAAKTDKITMGTGVTCPTLRYHPAIIAQAAATVACIAPRRVFLGVGTGEALNEYSATGQWPDYKTRQNQLAEAIEMGGVEIGGVMRQPRRGKPRRARSNTRGALSAWVNFRLGFVGAVTTDREAAKSPGVAGYLNSRTRLRL